MLKRLAPLLALAILSSAPMAEARSAKGHPHDHAAMWNTLHLTSSQQKQVKALHQAQMPKLKAAYLSVRQDIKTMLDLYADPNATNASMSAEYGRFEGDLTAAARAHFRHMQAMRDILTPAQRKLFVARLRHDHGDSVRFGAMMGDEAH